MGGKNPSGNLTPLSVDASGNLNVNSTLQGTSNINIADVAGSVPSATNGLAARITNGTSYVDPTQIRALTSTDVVTADQGGTWIVQPGNTPNTTPWLTTINQGGNSATVSAAGALKVDSSASTQPVSGTVTANQGTANATPWNENVAQFGGNAVVTGTGASGSGIPRVTVSNDSTVGIVAGSAIIGKVGIDQTTPGTTNGVQVNAALPAGSNTIGAVTQASGPWSQNLTEVGGSSLALGQTTMSASVPVTVASDQPAIPVSSVSSSSSSVTSVSGSASSVQLLASNTSRKNATFYNDSTAILYLKLGTTASTTSYTVQMAANSYYELPVGKIYTGEIDGIWASATGAVRITELS